MILFIIEEGDNMFGIIFAFFAVVAVFVEEYVLGVYLDFSITNWISCSLIQASCVIQHPSHKSIIVQKARVDIITPCNYYVKSFVNNGKRATSKRSSLPFVQLYRLFT